MQYSEPANGQTPTINFLPPEILSSIFIVLRQIRRYKHYLPFQVTLSHVCQRWRETAISTPHLWSTITLFSARSLPCVNEWLVRSGVTPLDVRLDLYDVDYRDGFDATWVKNTLADIASNSHRFQNLLIFTYHEVNVYHIFQLLERAKAPMLEGLTICVGQRVRVRQLTPFASVNGLTLPTPFTGGTPRLTSLELNLFECIPSLISITSLYLDLANLATSLHFDRLAEILQIPHSLVTLSLLGSVGQHSWWIDRDRPYVLLPKLRNLEFSSHGGTAVRFIIFFGMPNLESLRWHVESDNYQRLLDSPQFQVGMDRFPALKYLTLVDPTLTPSYLSMLMQIFPSPKHVLCSYPVIPERSFRSLQTLDGNQGWKKLQTLAFHKINGRQTRFFSREIKAVAISRPDIDNVLVDWELFSYMNTNIPDAKDLTTLGLLDDNSFPDYWWKLMREYTPRRL